MVQSLSLVMSPRYCALLGVVATLIATQADRAAADERKPVLRSTEIRLVKPEHMVLGASGANQGFIPSSDYRHLAYVFQHEGKQAVALDGVPGPLCDWVMGKPAFSPGGEHLGYVAGNIVERKLVWNAILDGAQGPAFDGMRTLPSGATVLFSPDGKHAAYVAVKPLKTASGWPRTRVRSLDAGEPVTGSGFVVSQDGYLLTCAHVLEDAAIVDVTLGGKPHRARVAKTEPKLDVALLKIDAKDLTPLPLSTVGAEIGIDVRAFGFPLTHEVGARLSVTRGTVSSEIERQGKKYLQIDAAINPGNSGGPLVTEQGEVIGIVNAKLTGERVSNVAFAIPIEQVRKLLASHRVALTNRVGSPPQSGAALVRRLSPAVGLVSVTTRRQLFDAGPIGKPFVVVDGVAHKPGEGYSIPNLRFAPDGKLMYVSQVRANNRSAECLVIDGEAGPPFDRVYADASQGTNGLVFSRDGKRLAYVAEERFHKCFVILDGVKQAAYDNITGLTFSPDGRHFAYFARTHQERKDEWVAVVDGQPGPVYDDLGHAWPVGAWPCAPAFSADGRHLAYGARRGDKQFLVVDGKEGKEYELPINQRGILPLPTFSPDGSRLAYYVQYSANAGKGPRLPGSAKDCWRVVVDDKEGEEFDEAPGRSGMAQVRFGTPVFSPNGKHIAYTACFGLESCVVLDGVVGKKYRSAGLLTFSPDSRHLAYVAASGSGNRFDYLVVRDGKEGKTYPGMMVNDPEDGLVFSPDSQHLAYVVLSRVSPSRISDVSFRVIVDDLESPDYAHKPLGPLMFDSSTALHTLAGPARVELALVSE
jgi:S1-C subfamily serine protease/WD40 repeat protein